MLKFATHFYVFLWTDCHRIKWLTLVILWFFIQCKIQVKILVVAFLDLFTNTCKTSCLCHQPLPFQHVLIRYQQFVIRPHILSEYARHLLAMPADRSGRFLHCRYIKTWRPALCVWMRWESRYLMSRGWEWIGHAGKCWPVRTKILNNEHITLR